MFEWLMCTVDCRELSPRLHGAAPFVTRILQITVRPETKFLDPMKCTTKDGVSNIFKNVQVISSVNTVCMSL